MSSVQAPASQAPASVSEIPGYLKKGYYIYYDGKKHLVKNYSFSKRGELIVYLAGHGHGIPYNSDKFKEYEDKSRNN